MISNDDIEAFRDADEALTRAENELTKGQVSFRHILPKDEQLVIKAGVFYREWAKALAVENLTLREAERRRGLEAMDTSREPER